MNTNTIKLTRANLHELSGSPGKCGFTKDQLALLGVSWPPSKGWLSRLIDTEISAETYENIKLACRKKWKVAPALEKQIIDPSRRIVCAALRNRQGEIIAGPRHFDPFMRKQIERSEEPDSWKVADQGFINSWGQYLNREDALHVALANNQRVRRCGGDTTELFSENLY